MHISLLHRASGGQNESEFVASIRDVFGAMGQALAVQNENLIVTQVLRDKLGSLNITHSKKNVRF